MVVLEAYLVFVQNQGDIDLIKMDEKQRCGLLILWKNTFIFAENWQKGLSLIWVWFILIFIQVFDGIFAKLYYLQIIDL